MKIKSINQCLVPDCDKHPITRGLCHNHYQSARHHVINNHTTWDKLEKLGKIKPSNRRNENWFLNGGK